MKKKLSYKELSLILIIFLFFYLINYERILFNSTNLEWVFIELAKYFHNNEYIFDIEKYKQTQINTIYLSYILSYLYNFNFSDTEVLIIFRFFILSFVFILCFLFIIEKKIEIDTELKIIIIIVLLNNPLLSIYLFRLYPETLAVLICFLSIYFLIKKKYAFSYFCYLISFLIKPFLITLAPIVFVYLYNNESLKKLYKITLIFFLISIISVFFIVISPASIFFNKHYDDYFTFSILKYSINIFEYIVYCIILTGPIYILFFFKYNNKKTFSFSIIISLLIMILSVFFYNSDGEMNLSFLSNLDLFIKYKNLIYSGLIFFSVFFVLIILREKKSFELAIILSIILLSFMIYRPANRYLVYILPFFTGLIILKTYSKNFKRMFYFFIILNLSLYIILNISQSKYQKIKYNSEIEIINFLSENNILKDTNLYILRSSFGYLSPEYYENIKPNYKYIVKICDMKKTKAIYNSEFNFFHLFKKNYCILNTKSQ